MSEANFELRFEWDEYKSILNEQEHGFPLDESRDAFYDPYALLKANAYRVRGEDRHILVGKSKKHGLLFVVHIEVEIDLIRLISARKAEPIEVEEYNKNIAKHLKQ